MPITDGADPGSATDPKRTASAPQTMSTSRPKVTAMLAIPRR